MKGTSRLRSERSQERWGLAGPLRLQKQDPARLRSEVALRFARTESPQQHARPLRGRWVERRSLSRVGNAPKAAPPALMTSTTAAARPARVRGAGGHRAAEKPPAKLYSKPARAARPLSSSSSGLVARPPASPPMPAPRSSEPRGRLSTACPNLLGGRVKSLRPLRRLAPAR
jgi:hypothetical protein